MNILIAEDEADMQKILRLYLQKEGYHVDTVSDGKAAVRFLTEHHVDLLVLDWMMPVQDGIRTCQEIRALHLPVKILMLTARGENEHEILGLSCGANDYMRKPFDIQILLLRIKKLCNLEGILKYQDITLNQDTFEVRKGGEIITLTRTEYDLLRYFLSNQRMILTRDQLLDHIWGMDFEGDMRTVDTHVRRLRKKIGGESIRTRIGMGYVMGGENE